MSFGPCNLNLKINLFLRLYNNMRKLKLPYRNGIAIPHSVIVQVSEWGLEKPRQLIVVLAQSPFILIQ